jgi:nucleoside-diphosphate-sugar epimerase
MKILITGALGYIGGECLLRFAQRPDVTVYAVDNDRQAIAARSSHFAQYSNINIFECDITDIHQLRKLPSADLIVHLAAKVGYMESSSDPELTEFVNVKGTANIASLYTPVIFFSTGSVYGKIGTVCNETVTPNPQTVYAETKLLAERALANVDHVVFRPATAYGVSLKMRHDLIVHDLIKQIVDTAQIDLYQPQAMRSFYSVQKLAELIEFACDNFALVKNNVYNVGCESGNVTKEKLLDIIGQHCDFDCDIIPGADADTRDYNVDYTKLAAVWPNYKESFADQIVPVIDYYKKPGIELNDWYF